MYYTTLAEIPVPASAQFLGRDTAQVRYSVRNHVRNVNTTLIKTITGLLASDSPSLSPLLDFDLVASVVSPSGKRRAVLREVKSGAAQRSRFVEVWCDDLLEASVDVSERHGAFYADEYLSSLAFSSSELAIVYTAESNQQNKSDNPYHRFRFQPDFGEGLDGKKRPTTFVLRWKPSTLENDDNEIALLPLSIPSHICLGQAIFSPNSENIIYATGYEYSRDGRMLGLKGCYNRPTGIWQVIMKNDPTERITCTLQKLTPSHLSCRSPRSIASAGSSTLLWLSCKTGGAHVSTSTLHALDITSDKSPIDPAAIEAAVDPVVDVVMNPIGNRFPGLYPSYNMPYSPVVKLQSQNHILIASVWGSRTTILLVSVKDGAVRDLTPASEELFSWSILATDGSCRFICSRSSPSIPYEVILGTLNDAGDVTWKVLDRPMLTEQGQLNYRLLADTNSDSVFSIVVSNILSMVRTSIVEIPGRYPTETIVVQSINSEASRLAPCITVPHGGPHATTTTAFAAATTAMVLEGCMLTFLQRLQRADLSDTLSLPNYTGSLGFGENSIQALIGNCGTLDVQDCVASINHLIDLGVAEHGPGKQFVMGGSHGGFLTAHLIGQYPSIFSAAVMRNPVISSGEISTSDLPDWYYSEFGFDYPVSTAPSSHLSDSGPIPLMPAETFSKLRAASPIAHVINVTVPVLLLIGDSDRRVAPTQGIGYYHALKSHFGSEGAVEMLVFEGESHPLDGVEAGKVVFEAGRDWFKNCTSKFSNLGAGLAA